VTAVPVLRPLEDGDVLAAHELMLATFDDLARRLGEDPYPPPGDPEPWLVRYRRLLASDPGGCWVAEDGAGLAGVALALVREGVWGLSLLVVRPDAQSGGLGRELLARALDHGDGARGAIVLASPDPRALRAYFRAGFALHASLSATGTPRGLEPPPDVRQWEPGDHELAARVDRALRGAAHGADLDALAQGGAELLVLPGRGYAAIRAHSVKLVAALDEEAAATLLRAALARVPAGARAEVDWMTGAQQWAIGVAVAAGLELRPAGAVCLRGDVGPLQPYLPSGAYL
jgi:GNAT superfamily N-acetyltransferase